MYGSAKARRDSRPRLPGERSSPGFRISLRSSGAGLHPAGQPRAAVALRLELFLQPLPNLEVLMIKLRSLHRKLRRLAHEASLKHERHGVPYIHRLQLRPARLLKSFRVRPVTSHAIMQAGAARDEAFRLGVIFTVDQPHELVHKVAMKPRRTKGMLGHHPSWRKDCEVNIRGSRNL